MYGLDWLSRLRCGEMRTDAPWQSMKILLLVLLMVLHTSAAQHAWEKPGCHRLGFTRKVYIPGCVRFELTANACRGFCKSYAIPSPVTTRMNNPLHRFTSRAECCAIADTHDVKVQVRCKTGYKELTFKSAATCACSVCRN